jgi:hypothetical protein
MVTYFYIWLGAEVCVACEYKWLQQCFLQFLKPSTCDEVHILQIYFLKHSKLYRKSVLHVSCVLVFIIMLSLYGHSLFNPGCRIGLF